MSGKGLMEQIRQHLIDGRTSRELIEMGFAAGSVYKTQREFRQGSPIAKSRRIGHEPSVSGENDESSAIEILRSENLELQRQMSEVREKFERLERIQSLLNEFEARLDSHTGQIERLRADTIYQLQAHDEQTNILDRRNNNLTEVVKAMGLLVMHLDMHHRQSHGLADDPADADIAMSDEGYWNLVKRLRSALKESFKGYGQKQKYGLKASLSDLMTERLLRKLNSR